ncbi:MAG: four helix bundle protein [Cyclobacteriaceae bacterium]
MRNFKDLEVWKESHQITLDIYKITVDFPVEEKYGIVSQMRRSATSIPTNIAEGCGRSGQSELKRFCDIAMGSASELEYQLILSNDLGYLTEHELESILESLVRLKKRLNSFIQYLKKSIEE